MRLNALAGVAVAVCLGATVAALQEAPQPPARFRTGVDVVQLDVTVLDAGHRPVRGLTAADFTVFENGEPQPIVALSEVDIPDRELPPASWMRDVAPDVRGNALPQGRLMVIVLDDATLLPDAFMVASAKRIARAVVDRLGPDDMAAVVFTLNARHAQDFTNDRARLLAAIDKLSPGPTLVGGDDELYYRYSIETLTKTTAMLSDVPRRRKALIYVSVGIPIDIEVASTPIALSRDSGSQAPGATQRDLIDELGRIGTTPTNRRGEMFEQVRETFQQALRSNVAIYAMDPAGLGGMANYLQERGRPMNPARMTPAEAFGASDLRFDFLRTVSENSGGFAVVNTNAPADAIPRIFTENGSYYMLGYAPANTTADGRFRRLEVRVNRPGVEVRARTGYFAPRAPDARATATAVDAAPTLDTAIGGLLPRRDMPMQVSAAPFALRGGKTAVAIVAAISQPAPSARVTQQVELLTSAFGPDGTAVGSRRQTAKLVLRPSAGPAQYEVLSQLDLEPGRYSLRIAAANPSLRLAASVYHDIVVPDFRRDAVSLSGVLVSINPGRNAAPRDALAALVPVVPTTSRVFTGSDAVSAFVRVYQGGRSPLGLVTVDARLTDPTGSRVFNAGETLPAGRFDVSRAADYALPIDIDRLKPGEYLLTIEARLGLRTTARRDVRFVVQGTR